MRLDQFISQATGLSRSQAQKLLRQGAFTLDTQILNNPKQHIDPQSILEFEQQPISLPQPLYLMLNKPQGVVSATEDPSQRTVLDIIQHPHKHTLHLVGRLDKDTTGLLLLTSEGEWSHQIASPRYKIGKTYLAELAEPLSAYALEQLRDGVQLKGEKYLTQRAQAELVTDTQLRLTIYEGMYHQVKRMLAAVGNAVVSLHREQIGGLKLDDELPSGQWRALTVEERESVFKG